MLYQKAEEKSLKILLKVYCFKIKRTWTKGKVYICTTFISKSRHPLWLILFLTEVDLASRRSCEFMLRISSKFTTYTKSSFIWSWTFLAPCCECNAWIIKPNILMYILEFLYFKLLSGRLQPQDMYVVIWEKPARCHCGWIHFWNQSKVTTKEKKICACYIFDSSSLISNKHAYQNIMEIVSPYIHGQQSRTYQMNQ